MAARTLLVGMTIAAVLVAGLVTLGCYARGRAAWGGCCPSTTCCDLAAKSDRSGKSGKSEKSGKSGKSGKSDRSDKSDKSDKSGKSDKSDKSEKSEKSGKSDKSDRTTASARIPREAAVKTALARVPGKVLEVELDGGLWDVEIRTGAGRVFEVMVDAATGKIVEVEDEGTGGG